MTPAPVLLTDQLANKLYDWSGGIPAYIIKIFQETQAQALLQGQSSINAKVMQKAIDLLAIKVPRTYSGGTYISEFSFAANGTPAPEESAVVSAAISVSETSAEEAASEVPRFYANKRGRPVKERDPADLLVAFRSESGMHKHLLSFDLLEVFSTC